MAICCEIALATTFSDLAVDNSFQDIRDPTRPFTVCLSEDEFFILTPRKLE